MKNGNRIKKLLFLLIPASVFLCFPRVGFGDIPPAFWGAILAFPLVFVLSYVNEQMAECRKSLWKVLASGIVQSLVCLWVRTNVPVTAEHPFEQPAAVLVVAFSFSVLDLCFLLPTVKTFCNGVLLLTDAENAQITNRFEKIQSKILPWLILSRVFWVLPECSVLTSYEYHNENPLFSFDWYNFITIFRGVGAILSAAIGIPFLITVLKGTVLLQKDREWSDSVEERFQREKALHPEKIFADRMKTVAWAFALAVLSLADLKINFRPLVPIWLPCLLFSVGLYLIPKKVFSRTLFAVLSGIAGGIGLVAAMLRNSYLEDFLPKDALYQTDAYERFLPIRVLELSGIILTAMTFGLFFFSVLAWIKKEVFVRFENDPDRTVSKKASEKAVRNFTKKSVLPILLTASVFVLSFADALIEPNAPWICWVQTFLCIWDAFAVFGFSEELSEQICSQITNA